MGGGLRPQLSVCLGLLSVSIFQGLTLGEVMMGNNWGPLCLLRQVSKADMQLAQSWPPPAGSTRGLLQIISKMAFVISFGFKRL